MRLLYNLTYLLFIVIPLMMSSLCLAEGYVHNFTVKTSVSLHNKSKVFIHYNGCFSIHTGKAINCKVNYKLNGLTGDKTDPEINGGHTHSYETRPLTDTEFYKKSPYYKKDITSAGDTDPDPLSVLTTTLGNPTDWALIEYPLPVFSGKLSSTILVTTPFGWHCVKGCFTYTSRKYEFIYDMGFHKLQEIPDMTDLYIKGRNPDEDHTDEVAFFGSELMINILPKIAQDYLDFTDKKISLNDASLPKGGHFDIFGDWHNPHKTHYDGSDIDLNRVVDCDKDDDLKFIVGLHLVGVYRPNAQKKLNAVLCEWYNKTNSYSRIHIDFEGAK